MKKIGLALGTGMLAIASATAMADDQSKEEKVAAAEQGCLKNAQSRYGVGEDDVWLTPGKVRWDSGLKGYRVEIVIRKSEVNEEYYYCIARKDGSFKFFSV